VGEDDGLALGDAVGGGTLGDTVGLVLGDVEGESLGEAVRSLQVPSLATSHPKQLLSELCRAHNCQPPYTEPQDRGPFQWMVSIAFHMSQFHSFIASVSSSLPPTRKAKISRLSLLWTWLPSGSQAALGIKLNGLSS